MNSFFIFYFFFFRNIICFCVTSFPFANSILWLVVYFGLQNKVDESANIIDGGEGGNSTIVLLRCYEF